QKSEDARTPELEQRRFIRHRRTDARLGRESDDDTDRVCLSWSAEHSSARRVQCSAKVVSLFGGGGTAAPPCAAAAAHSPEQIRTLPPRSVGRKNGRRGGALKLCYSIRVD